jgi:cation:H+ antiporter
VSLLVLAQLGAGLALLVLGAEALVRGASRLAARLGVSELVIGLTLVAFGTSAPEFTVTVVAALGGQDQLALGNVIGSNICNVLLILGVAALVSPLVVSYRLVRLEVPLVIGASLLVWIQGLDGRLGRLDASLLFAGLAAYTIWSVVESRGERMEGADRVETGRFATLENRLAVQLALVGGGLGLLVLGSRWLVEGATDVALAAGVSELVIGLTLVAVGTSLPELATSVVASLRRQNDIAVGNVVGSSLFNLLGVLGVAGLVADGGLRVSPAVQSFDAPVMIAVAVACLPVALSGLMARWQGALFLAYYVAYVAYLILGATQHDALHGFTAAMLDFVLPLTVLTLVLIAVRATGRRRGGPS